MVGTGSRLFFASPSSPFSGRRCTASPVVAMSWASSPSATRAASVSTSATPCSSSSGPRPWSSALFSVALRDADPDATAALQASDVLPEVAPPASASPWPMVGAFGLVVTALGLVVGPGLFVLGLVLLAVTAIEWAVQVWADRATGDPEVNRAIRNRLMAPLEIPVGAVLVIALRRPRHLPGAARRVAPDRGRSSLRPPPA